jgi:hypothetical protein
MPKRVDLSAMKQDWRDMYQERTCPGHAICSAPNHAHEVEEHRKRCAHCAARTPEAVQPWKELGEALQSFCPDTPPKGHDTGDGKDNLAHLFPAPPHAHRPHPGEIWSLKEKLGHWDKRHRYINPPVVVVTEVLEEVRGVRVAQTFMAPHLTFEGDVAIGSDFGHAETWNTYALRFEDLDRFWGMVDKEVLAEIQKTIHSQDLLQEPEEDSIIHFFRELEMEIAHFMAIQALPVLVHRHEHPGWPDWMADPEQVRKKILAFESRASVPDTDDPLVMLAITRLPREMTKMAASEFDKQLSYNVITWGENDQPSCRTGLAVVEGVQFSNATIHVEGWLDKQDREAGLLAWWKHGEEYMEGAVERDPENGYFEIDFARCSQEELDKGELILLVVEHPRTHHRH